MTDREKLIELLNVDIYPHEAKSPAEVVADYLLDNGVTFATDKNVGRWIPVTERLPEREKLVLCIGKKGGMFLANNMTLFSDGTCHCNVHNARSGRYATHWMPLPEPPEVE